MNRTELIRERLSQAFSPTHLVITDESEHHRGHAGYQGGGHHFAIIIRAECFKELSRLETHRKIYQVLQDMLPEQIHALRINIVR